MGRSCPAHRIVSPRPSSTQRASSFLMTRAQRTYRLLLLVGLGLLPLLLAGWSVSSNMAHDPWFYLLTFLIPVFGLASAYYAVHHRLQPSPSRLQSDVRARRHVTTDAPTTYSVLLTVALPSSGPELLRVARALAPPDQLHVTAMHCWPEARFRAEAFEGRGRRTLPEPLRPLLEEAGRVSVDPLCFVSADVGSDIVSMAEERGADLVLLG